MFNFFQSIADTIGMIIDYVISLIQMVYFLLLPFRRRLPISVRLFYICLFSCVLLYCCLSRLLLSYRL